MSGNLQKLYKKAKSKKNKTSKNKTRRHGGKYNHKPSLNKYPDPTTTLEEERQRREQERRRLEQEEIQRVFLLVEELRNLIIKSNKTSAELERIEEIFRLIPPNRIRQLIAELQSLLESRN